MYVAILGAGESGIGAAQLAVKLKYETFVSDSGKIAKAFLEELNNIHVPFEEGGHSFEKLANADLVIKSPGIPDSARIVQALRSHMIPVISEIEFASRHCEGKIIAITGTNGKTTTAMMCHHILRTNGLSSELCGNVGNSFARCLAEGEADWYVVEVSSFQLDDIEMFRPDVGILLNITPDHLDRYDEDFEKYVSAKLRLIENQTSNDVLIYNAAEAWLVDRVRRAAETVRLIGVEEVISTVGMPFGGWHNAFNATCAILAASEAGIDEADALKALRSFEKADHRMQEVRVLHGVRWINDSKATNTDAAFFALDAVKGRIVWIAGGQDKGNDYSRLLDVVRSKVKGIICLGLSNEKLFEAFSSEVEIMRETTNVNEAVEMAASIASEGDTVLLLSPACASFDLFLNYKERGRQYMEAVLQLTE